VFDIYDIDKREYLPQSKLFEICEDFKLPPAEIIIHAVWTMSNFEQFRQFAEQSYSNGKPAEGIVVRVQDFDDDKRISFKIINLNYKG
jgi:ATP-dependent RNA circularization protein (DNA/RNA ligase family)